MSESEQKGRLRREITAAYEGTRYKPSDSDMLIADAIDRLAADVAAVKAKIDAVSPDDVAHLVECEKAWVRLVEEKETAAIRERDEWKEEARLAVVNRDEARAEVERLRMQLAACGVLADCNTTDSLERNRRVHLDYDCAAVQSVIRAVGREIALRAEIEKLKAMFEQQTPAAPQPAAPAAGRLTEREQHALRHILAADVEPAIRSMLARAGSPPVVEVPLFENYAPEVLHLRYRDAISRAGIQWKEVGRE